MIESRQANTLVFVLESFPFENMQEKPTFSLQNKIFYPTKTPPLYKLHKTIILYFVKAH